MPFANEELPPPDVPFPKPFAELPPLEVPLAKAFARASAKDCELEPPLVPLLKPVPLLNRAKPSPFLPELEFEKELELENESETEDEFALLSAAAKSAARASAVEFEKELELDDELELEDELEAENTARSSSNGFKVLLDELLELLLLLLETMVPSSNRKLPFSKRTGNSVEVPLDVADGWAEGETPVLIIMVMLEELDPEDVGDDPDEVASEDVEPEAELIGVEEAARPGTETPEARAISSSSVNGRPVFGLIGLVLPLLEPPPLLLMFVLLLILLLTGLLLKIGLLLITMLSPLLRMAVT